MDSTPGVASLMHGAAARSVAEREQAALVIQTAFRQHRGRGGNPLLAARPVELRAAPAPPPSLRSSVASVDAVRIHSAAPSAAVPAVAPTATASAVSEPMVVDSTSRRHSASPLRTSVDIR
jgi:hypothetical protein